MRSAGVSGLGLALALASSGCFTSFVAVQASGHPEILDESVRESAVPLGGPREELHVRMPLAIEYDAPTPAPATTGGTGATPSAPAVARPFQLSCTVTQRGQDTVYHAAFRYGHTWKWATAIMFAVEAGAAALTYASNSSDPGTQLGAALLAADAIGTGVIAFAPREEIYRSEVKPVDTLVRTDCPDGLALDVGGEPFAVDAAGRLGELGTTALADWMRSPHGALRLTLGGQEVPLPIGGAEQCAWHLAHDPATRTVTPGPAACGRQVPPRDVAADLIVPLGTLTRAE